MGNLIRYCLIYRGNFSAFSSDLISNGEDDVQAANSVTIGNINSTGVKILELQINHLTSDDSPFVEYENYTSKNGVIAEQVYWNNLKLIDKIEKNEILLFCPHIFYISTYTLKSGTWLWFFWPCIAWICFQILVAFFSLYIHSPSKGRIWIISFWIHTRAIPHARFFSGKP